MVIVTVTNPTGEINLFYAKTSGGAGNALLLKHFTPKKGDDSLCFWENTDGRNAIIGEIESSIAHISELK